MTRKRKIQFAVASIALVIIPMGFWPGKDEEAFSVTYAGISTNDPNFVWFTISNRSKTAFRYGTCAQSDRFRGFRDHKGPPWGDEGQIEGESAKDFDRSVPTTNQWRVQVAYLLHEEDAFGFRIRRMLLKYALIHNWSRISQWLWPVQKWKYAYGPVMLGNKPVTAGEK